MTAVLPGPLRLIGRMGLASVGVHLPGLLGMLRHNESPLVVGIYIMPKNPAAVVAPIGQLYHLIPPIIDAVCAYAVGQVHRHGAVQGVVLVGRGLTPASGHSGEVAVQIVLIGHCRAVGIEDGR
jgi:3-deoxy-D-arabino-heptulosonate 7-phosphate (DAHP) synthase class II